MWPTLVSPSWFDKKDFTIPRKYEPRLRNSENDLDPPLLPIKRINYDRYNFYPFRQHLHFRAVWLFFINIIIKPHEENHIWLIMNEKKWYQINFYFHFWWKLPPFWRSNERKKREFNFVNVSSWFVMDG